MVLWWMENNKKDDFTYYNPSSRGILLHNGNILFSFVEIPGDNKKRILSLFSKITKSVKCGLCKHESIRRYDGMKYKLFFKIC